MDKNNKGHCSQRDFTATAVSAAAFTIVPRHVLGGPGFTPPSDKVNLAVIGLGRQGMVVMMHLLQLPEIQVVSVCDVNQGSTVAVGKGSIDWKKVFTAAKTGGVESYFIEQNMEMTKEGVAFLKALKV